MQLLQSAAQLIDACSQDHVLDTFNRLCQKLLVSFFLIYLVTTTSDNYANTHIMRDKPLFIRDIRLYSINLEVSTISDNALPSRIDIALIK